MIHNQFPKTIIGKKNLTTLSEYYFRGEYFLTDYIYKIGNFDGGMVKSGFNAEGFFDNYNLDSNEFSSATNIIQMRQSVGYLHAKKRRYEFVITPNVGFLANPIPLMKNTELKLSFDRASPAVALLKNGDITTECKYIELDDVYATTEYISSPEWRNYFEYVDAGPLVYEYEDCDVLIKNLEKGSTEFRFDNLRGGQVPRYIFMALIPQKSLNGDFDHSSTRFTACNVIEANVTLNGNSVDVFPITIKNNSAVYPFHKFIDDTGRLYNSDCGGTLLLSEFEFNFLWSHKFEASVSPNGWIGLSLKTSEEFQESEPMSLVVWVVSKTALSIDKFHQIEKINV